MIERLTGDRLDKGAQFTEWFKRALTESQLSYAANDVLYLPEVWQTLQKRLVKQGRLEWLLSETNDLCEGVSQAKNPELAYLEIGRWQTLKAEEIGILKELAAWRLNEAFRSNRPLGWIIEERLLLDIARSRPREIKNLRRVRGAGDAICRKYGDEILEAVQLGRANPITPPPKRKQHHDLRSNIRIGILVQIINAVCANEGVAPRFVGSRNEVEQLVRWFDSGAVDPEPDISMLHGWRRDFLAKIVLDWLKGKSVIGCSDDFESGLIIKAGEN